MSLITIAVCVAGLLTGNYTVKETTPPPGYGGDGSSHTATVVADEGVEGTVSHTGTRGSAYATHFSC